MHDEQTLADDLIEGVGPAATFIYGSDDSRTRRRVHYLLEIKKIPAGKLGDRWLFSKSKLRAAFDRLSGTAA